MKELFFKVFDLHNRDDTIKRINRIALILGWYMLFSTYPIFRSDNQVVRFLVGLTLFLLVLFFVASLISTALKYKGAIKEMIQRLGWLDAINCILWIVMMVYQLFMCPGPYMIVVSYLALTILLINLILQE